VIETEITLSIFSVIVELKIVWNRAKPYILLDPFIPLILFKISLIATWTLLFLTTEVMEAVRGQTSSSEGQKAF
jgi:hypothetical protein